MDSRTVLLIFNNNKFTKEYIINDIVNEKFSHKFLFVDPHRLMQSVRLANEIWMWGDCTNLTEYIVAKDLGKDLWQMG